MAKRVDDGVPQRPSAMATLRGRLPTLIAQALSVIFAVLVALAVDQAWEERENRALGRRGLDGIVAEMTRNLDRLEEGRPRIDSILAGIDSVTRILEADNDLEDIEVEVDYPVALLSSAAWQTAQVTRAVHFVPIDVVTRIAGVYDLQAFFMRNQELLTDQIAGTMATPDMDTLRLVRELGSRYRLVAGFRRAVATAYRCVLADLEEGAEEMDASCTEQS